MNKFKNLRVCQESMDLTELVYKLTAQFPDFEKFGLKSQIHCCTVSVPNNIAEGCGRTSKDEFKHFFEYYFGFCLLASNATTTRLPIKIH